MLVDTHAHLYWDSYNDNLDQVIKRSLDSGVTTIINVGVDVNLSKKALQQARDKLANIPGLTVYSTIGIHPHEALRQAQGKLFEEIEALERIYISNPEKVIAVGECGLDYFFDNEYNSHNDYNNHKKKQKKLFQAQIELAKKLKLPLIVHCRDDRSKNLQNSECWDEVLKMTKDWFGLYHCYSGLSHNTEYIIQNTNFLISFAANITYPKNEYLREAAKAIPLERICLETDSPFLSPQSKRGQRNEPAAVLEIAEIISEVKGIPLNQVANRTTNNAYRMLRLRSA